MSLHTFGPSLAEPDRPALGLNEFSWFGLSLADRGLVRLGLA